MISNRCQSAALPVLRVNDLLTVFPLGSGSSFLLWCQSVGGVCEGCVFSHCIANFIPSAELFNKGNMKSKIKEGYNIHLK
jgi:hypothetical protein